ncbi:hypothetical protein AB0K47_29070 [Streptomyces tirandamycinicus]|uniref:hypothetical protein n=1 Tax=Streptomyces tirandamycinicus TaxID=2174846 RepID=UPI0034184D1A
MGVFARFRRKAEAAVEVPAEERATGCTAASSEGGADGEPAKDAVRAQQPVEASAKEPVEASTGSAGGGGGEEGGETEDRAGSGADEAPAAGASRPSDPAGTEDRAGSGADEAPAAGASRPSDPAGSPGAEHVEIPKQQSVDEAADNEAGEGARQ